MLPNDSLIHKIKRIQLIFPPMVFSPFQSRQTALFPMGLGYIGSALEQDGYELDLVDCPSEGYDTILEIDKDRSVYGLTEEQIRQRIEKFRPDMIGISCLFSTLEKRMLIVARIAKEVDPNIIVVVGGPHVSAFYHRVIAHSCIDYCVIGEGEHSARSLVKALNGETDISQVSSICYRKGGRVIHQPRTAWIQDLDDLPYPAYHMVDYERYFKIGRVQGLRMDGDDSLRLAQMTTSRGCPFQCTYCAKNATWGTKYRTRSAEHVLDEMEYLIERYGIERFAFQDDNFTADMKRAEKIFDGIVDRGFNITWEAHNGLGVNYLSPELMDKMKASGCVSFTIAVESSNDATLERVKKPNYITMAPPIVKKAKELDIEVRGFFMIGFPGETIEEVWNTVAYSRQLDLAVSAFAVVTPLPGTVLYTECVQQGLIDESTVDFEDLSFGAFELELSEVPIEKLKSIRKIEWLRTVLMDDDDNFNVNTHMAKKDVMEEINNGLVLFPENQDMQRLHAQASHFYENKTGTATDCLQQA